ncbi:subtilisin-like protein [Thozetella sp. PMI_491]|nr:subtilisin-like protein [Thozetella sp. PMI_491]
MARQQRLVALFCLFLRHVRAGTPSQDEVLGDMPLKLQSPDEAGVEANLDVQYTVGLVNGIPVTFLSSGQPTLNGTINVANHILSKRNPPSVLVIPYGFNEDQIDSALARNLCNSFQKLGAQGVSVIVPSGDGGVGGISASQQCTTFIPTFPATCPYVTVVGGTTGNPLEHGAQFSAGGFSNIFSRPSYQNYAVGGYLQRLGSMHTGRYNSTGRAFPDVSAQASDFVIVRGGQKGLLNSTSAAAMVFASTIALINNELVAGGKPRLGFLNPWLYSGAGNGLTDVSQGSNPGCGTNGFSAIQGWDPITGLGTPKYNALKAKAGL